MSADEFEEKSQAEAAAAAVKTSDALPGIERTVSGIENNAPDMVSKAPDVVNDVPAIVNSGTDIENIAPHTVTSSEVGDVPIPLTSI